jgi:hypothetical protein
MAKKGAMALPDRIHIFGASGSGVTTLAAATAERFGHHRHLDVDEFFWEPTVPPFRNIRPVAMRLTRAGSRCCRAHASASKATSPPKNASDA